MRIKVIIILLLLSYQNSAYSKATEKSEFNQRYLSSYFSALISSDKQRNDKAIKFFNTSKSFLIKSHSSFLKEYVFSLVLDGQIRKAVDQIKISKNKKNSNFFEFNLLLAVDSFKKKITNKP